MYALKLELKLNNKERFRLAGCAGFSRFVYNFGLSLLTQSWGFEDVKAGDSKRLAAIEKVFTQYVKPNPEYAWMQQYPSAIYSSAFRNLASIANVRQDFLQKTTTAISQKYYRIRIEDLKCVA